MATGAEWSCPICREASGNIAYVDNCLHQFCRDCIVRWATKKPSCPLCRQTVRTIIYTAPPDHDYVEMTVPQLSVSRSAGPLEHPVVAGPQRQANVAGFPSEIWALFFRSHTEILRPVELWLNEVLGGPGWWDVIFAKGRIIASLCRYGLHDEALTRELHPFLEEQTPVFVRQLIQVAADQCSEQAWRLVDVALQQNWLGGYAYPDTSGAQEERPEAPRQAEAGARAGAAGAGQSSGCGPGGSGQSGRGTGGGRQDAGATQKKPCGRQN